VTIAGKSASGIVVVATVSNSFFDAKTIAKATTDDEGNYKLSRLPAGRLSIFPLSKAFIVKAGDAYKKPEQSVNVSEGEVITKIDFALVRGGVVTGRITDADGHPLIGEHVSVLLKDAPATARQMMMFGGSRNQTDDRGVYRVYGLSPGSYKVSVGQAAGEGGGVTVMGMGGSQYVKTFYPGVQEEAKATLLEIKEGSEVRSIDITVGKLGNGFSVAGRVVDADSGQPVPNVYIGHSAIDATSQEMGAMNFSGGQSDANGKFRVEGLRPGHYAVYTMAPQADNSTYSEPTRFEITDGDVSGIEIKLRRGATLSGVAVLDNNSDPTAAGLLQTLSVYAYMEKKGGAPSYSQGKIAADGSFKFSGLAPGRARIGIQGFPAPPKGLALARVELDGVEQPEGIEVAAGAKLSGVRLVFVYGTGSVRGEVKADREVPEGTLIQVAMRSAPGDARQLNRTTLLDNRLHFVLENIPPGTYELVVQSVTKSGVKPAGPVELLKQSVTVTNGTEVKVSLTVELPKQGGEQ
jgi:protocatechuate 3,4-dioxygenase beta subunit